VDALPIEAYAAALAGLPAMPPRRLASLLRRRRPEEAWSDVVRGASQDEVTNSLLAPLDRRQQWQAHARRRPPERVWARCVDAGISVHLLGGPTYPPTLGADHEAPAVLFSRGSMDALNGPRAGIVGTRNSTASGQEIAFELGHDLAANGVRVVSGLARGIDGWAHRGVLEAAGAPPVGVVACGLDVPYPAEHRALWAAVAERGVLLAEVPPGTAPQAYRFPLRNRILACVSDVVVVVESRVSGGSLITASEAGDRGVPVLAVPGSPRSPASVGANRLLVDGCTPVLDVTDVLVALGLASAAGRVREPTEWRPPPGPFDQTVLDLFGNEALDLERIAGRAGCPPIQAALSLGRLEASGWVTRTSGWFERIGGRR
jgi:DNA processing protein